MWWQISAHQKVCRNWWAEQHAGWVWAVGLGSSQYLSESNTQRLALQRSIHFTAFLSHSASAALSPSPFLLLPLLCHCRHHTLCTCFQQPFFLVLSLSLLLSFFFFLHPPSSSLFISPSSTLSLLIPRNAVCGRLWLFGCWYLRLCSEVSDFHWCFERDCARTSVCVCCMCCKYCMCSCMSVPPSALVPNNCEHSSSQCVCWCAAKTE